MIYVFDLSLSRKLPQALRLLLPEPDEDPIVVHHDLVHLSEIDCGKEQRDPLAVIAAAEERPHILVTCITASKRKLVTIRLREMGLRAVHLAEGYSQLTGFVQAARLMNMWEKIVAGSYRLRPGHAVHVGMNGTVAKVE